MSAAIDEDHENWGEIEGLSLGGTAARVTDPDEIAKAKSLFTAKFPQVSAFSEDEIRTAMDLYRLTPSVISVLDYTKGFGHTDLVTVSESDQSCVPGGSGKPRSTSAADIGFLPARCSSIRRTAPEPHAIVSASSSTTPGAPLPVHDGWRAAP